jgi:hypothetical protein
VIKKIPKINYPDIHLLDDRERPFRSGNKIHFAYIYINGGTKM